MDHPTMLTRRRVVAGPVIAGLAAMLSPIPVSATPETMRAAMRDMFGPEPGRSGRITMDLPIISETGNAVRLGLKVESPMTETDHVRRIHVFSEGNPLPHIATFHLGPRSGKAEIETRVRIAQDQTVVAVAEMSDGSRWTDSGHITVALGACTDDLLGNDAI